MVSKQLFFPVVAIFFCLPVFSQTIEKTIKLPEPALKGKKTFEEVLLKRRSIRLYKDDALLLTQISQLMFAAQGITAPWGGRTSPSAGATYPVEIYLVAGNVEGLKPGLYHYIVSSHSLVQKASGDIRKMLSLAALKQKSIEKAPATIVIAAEFSRTTGRYGERGIRYVYMEAGHVSQNIYLQAESIGLGTVAIGAFDDKLVKDIMKINQDVLYLMPVGKKSSEGEEHD